MTDKVKSIIRNYLFFQLSFTLLWWVPVFFIFQKDHGISESEIFKIQSIYYIVFSFLEIPTGWLSDKFGHRWAMAAASFFLFVSNLIPLITVTYISFLLHFLIIALARSLASGAASAYLYDYLDKNNLKDEYKRIEGKARTFSLVGRMIVWPMVGPLMKIWVLFPYFLTSINAIIGLVVSLKLPKFEIQNNPSNAFPSFSNIFLEIKNSPLLISFIFQGAGIFILQRILLVQIFQPVLIYQKFSIESFGLLLGAITLIESIGSFNSNKLKRWISDENAIFIICIGVSLCFFILPILNQFITIITLGFCCFLMGLAFPIQKKILNDNIKNPQYRASLLSFESLIDRLICSLAAYLIGIELSNGGGLPFILNTTAICSLIIVILFYVLIHYQKQKIVIKSEHREREVSLS
ncbi:MFS transporter [Bacteriovoracaceae bacterium]|nr:MFS transporter [Bacteriovoracaceae bacterium]